MNELLNKYKHIFNDTSNENLIILLILISSSVFFFILSKTKVGRSTFLFFFTFPGTIIHEFLHFLLGILFLAQPASFSLFPKREDNGWTLGSVEFYNINSFNAIPIAMAPLLAPILLLISFPYIYEYISMQENSILLTTTYGFVLISILSECIPSSQDFKVMFSKPFGFIFYFVIGYVLIENFEEMKELI